MTSIIPAIDIIGGKCVRLTQGDYDRRSEYGDPIDMARAFEDVGCRRLHVVDLDGAKASHIVNYRTLESIATRTNLTIDFGGGVKSDDDIRIAFDCGAAMVTGGSIAVKQPDMMERWIEKYGSDSIILGADARDGKVATDGWHEESKHDVVDFIAQYVEKGITQTICTDIACDGMLQGPSFSLYSALQQQFPKIRFTASGGIGAISDIIALDRMGLDSVIVGKALYEDRISLDEIRRYLKNGSDFS